MVEEGEGGGKVMEMAIIFCEVVEQDGNVDFGGGMRRREKETARG